jgi:hypothetical protein
LSVPFPLSIEICNFAALHSILSLKIDRAVVNLKKFLKTDGERIAWLGTGGGG